MWKKRVEGMPDFLIIGAGKSGTTSVDKYLAQHPQIFIPMAKEPNFFGYEFVKESDFNGNQEEIAHFRKAVTTLEKYLKLFSEAKPGQLRGETSNTYMYHPQAPERIKYYNPDVKLIAVLRQPAGRLYSRFMHLARENRTPTKLFSDCMDRNSIWWKRNDLIQEGFYFKNLTPYYNLFPAENIRVYLFEDLQEKPFEVMAELYSFLGVDSTFRPDVTVRYNESGIVKNPLMNKIYGQGGLISRSLRAVFPETVVEKLRGNLTLKKKVFALRGKNLHKPSMDPEVRKFLTHEVYAADIRQLEKLINRDLSRWLR